MSPEQRRFVTRGRYPFLMRRVISLLVIFGLIAPTLPKQAVATMAPTRSRISTFSPLQSQAFVEQVVFVRKSVLERPSRMRKIASTIAIPHASVFGSRWAFWAPFYEWIFLLPGIGTGIGILFPKVGKPTGWALISLLGGFFLFVSLETLDKPWALFVIFAIAQGNFFADLHGLPKDENSHGWLIMVGTVLAGALMVPKVFNRQLPDVVLGLDIATHWWVAGILLSSGLHFLYYLLKIAGLLPEWAPHASIVPTGPKYPGVSPERLAHLEQRGIHRLPIPRLSTIIPETTRQPILRIADGDFPPSVQNMIDEAIRTFRYQPRQELQVNALEIIRASGRDPDTYRSLQDALANFCLLLMPSMVEFDREELEAAHPDGTLLNQYRAAVNLYVVLSLLTYETRAPWRSMEGALRDWFNFMNVRLPAGRAQNLRAPDELPLPFFPSDVESEEMEEIVNYARAAQLESVEGFVRQAYLELAPLTQVELKARMIEVFQGKPGERAEDIDSLYVVLSRAVRDMSQPDLRADAQKRAVRLFFGLALLSRETAAPIGHQRGYLYKWFAQGDPLPGVSLERRAHLSGRPLTMLPEPKVAMGDNPRGIGLIRQIAYSDFPPAVQKIIQMTRQKYDAMPLGELQKRLIQNIRRQQDPSKINSLADAFSYATQVLSKRNVDQNRLELESSTPNAEVLRHYDRAVDLFVLLALISLDKRPPDITSRGFLQGWFKLGVAIWLAGQALLQGTSPNSETQARRVATAA